MQVLVDENPELKWWFDEVEKSTEKLLEAAKKCDSLSGIEQKLVSYCLPPIVSVKF